MANICTQRRWSPYWVGGGIGVLSWITFYFMDKALGVSTSFVRAVGIIGGSFSEQYIRGNEYLTKYLVGKPAFEWQFTLVIALFFGALVSAVLSGTYRKENVPSLWARRFGTSALRRFTVAFFGGMLVLFGARLAGGCTSGHGISGGLQLALSGWIFLASIFASGIATAFVLYGKQGASSNSLEGE